MRVVGGGIAVALVLVSTAAHAQTAERLHQLMQVPGVAGHEDAVRDAVEMQLPAATRVRADTIGNIVMRTGGQEGPMTLIAAPLDESGFVVSAITDDGYLRVHRHTAAWTGRLAAQWFVGQPVEIHTASGAVVPGVFATPSTHLNGLLDPAERARVRTLDDLFIDVGATTREQVTALGVRMLDSVTLRERATRLAGNRVSGIAATQRAAAQSIVELILRAGERPRGNGRVNLAWVTQSQYGHRGLLRAVAESQPETLVVLRGNVAPAEDARGTVAVPGQGPVIADDDAALAAVAKAAGVTVQALPAARLRAGLPSSLKAKAVHVISVPALFAHTPVETVDAADVEAVVKLLQAVTGMTAAGNAPSAPLDAPEPATPQPSTGGAGTQGTQAVLAELIETYGVSGHEAPVRDVVLKHMPAWAKPVVDAKGNVVVRFGNKAPGQKTLAFIAHMDEVGFEITRVEADGTAKVRTRGGMYLSVYEGHPVVVVTPKGRVPALLMPRTGYVSASTSQPGVEQLALYFGTDSAGATRALGVEPGQSATVRKAFVPLADGRYTGRAMDDRNGCAALLQALREIDPSKVPGEAVFAWVVEEEVGLAGAQALVDAKERPHTAFAVDTFVSTDSPVDIQRLAGTPLGGGAVLRGMDSRTLVRARVMDSIAAIAREAGIPLQIGVTQGGTDASVFSEVGSIDVGLSWPGKYSHSPVEIMDERDQRALISLIVHVAYRY